jgi:hypothetical protein
VILTTSRRREFLKLLGFAALSVQVLPLTACDSAPEHAPADSLTVTSSLGSKLGHWAYHSHFLYVPLQLFRAPPPEGVTLSTTRTYLHTHEVVLSQAELLRVARGESVEVADSVRAHTYSLRLG